jgi:hypothetical protein
LSVLAVLFTIAAILAPGYFRDAFSDKTTEQTTTVFSLDQSTYTTMLTGTGELTFPPLQTDIANLFYTINPADGIVAYYEATTTGLVPYTGTVETTDISVTCSNRDISVKLSYVQQGEEFTGYGLFTAATAAKATGDKAPSDIFAYAFIKLTTLPAAYGKSGQLLLVDFDKNSFWLDDKLYTEAFIININNPGSTAQNPRAAAKSLTTDNTRTVDFSGAFRSDWVMLYDDFLDSLGQKPYFLSSRDYNLDSKGLVTDILITGTKKPPRVVQGMLGLWARVDKNNLIYLKATEQGFDCLKFDSNDEQIVKSFVGNYFEDYLQSGQYLLNKNTLVLTDLLTGEEKTLTSVLTDSVAFFSISPDGLRAAVATAGAGEDLATATQTLVLCNLETGTTTTVSEPLIFSQTNPNFCWIDNNTLFHLRPTNDDTTGLSYCIIIVS